MVTTILKATRDCNLACKYCYTEIRDTNEKIKISTLEKFFSDLKIYEFENSKDKNITTEIIWHGGEPLLMGIEFYKKAIEIQKSLETENFHYSNLMQTNGTLLTQEYWNLLHQNKFKLGISLDGPEEINDRTRLYKDGSSTFEDVMKGVKIISKNQSIQFLAVISSKNIDELDEVINFFHSGNYSVKFNPLIPSGCASENEDLALSTKKYGAEVSKLFSKWFANDSKDYAHIENFKDMIKSYMESRPYGCNYSKTCQSSFTSLAPNGDIYPCARFDGIEEFKLGNILTDSLSNIMKNPIREKLNTRYKTLDESCKSCDINNLCNGGCMHNAYLSGDIMSKDPFCPSHKKIFGTVKEELETYIQKIA